MVIPLCNSCLIPSGSYCLQLHLDQIPQLFSYLMELEEGVIYGHVLTVEINIEREEKCECIYVTLYYILCVIV